MTPSRQRLMVRAIDNLGVVICYMILYDKCATVVKFHKIRLCEFVNCTLHARTIWCITSSLYSCHCLVPVPTLYFIMIPLP